MISINNEEGKVYEKISINIFSVINGFNIRGL